MKLLTLFLKREELKNKLKQTVIRFPLACLISLWVTMLFYSLVWWVFMQETSEIIWKYILTWIVTFFLSVWLTLYVESVSWNRNYIIISYIISIIFWCAFYFFLSTNFSDIETLIYFILTLFWVVSLLFSGPYLRYLSSWKYKESSYYLYFYRISTVLFMSMIVGWSLALWGSLAIMAVHVLFDIGYSASWDMYGYWISLALVLVTPLFALSEIPKKWEFENSTFKENIFFNFLIRYVATPFIYVYFFILYAYTLKVLINFSDWPKWEVSWLVIWFSLFWYVTYMFSYIFESKKDENSYKFIKTFRKYFPYVVLPQVWMLFYAIFLRIWQYDLTMNRYFVVVFGIWLLASSMYLIVSKTKSILIIPTLLTLFTLIVSVGPWSVYNFPLSRQTDRLENNLIEANILSDWVITPLGKVSDIDETLSSQIYDGIDYICSFDNCNNIKDLFPSQYWELLEKDKQDYENRQWIYEYKGRSSHDTYTQPNKWEIVNYITGAIKVQRSYNGKYIPDTKYLYRNDNNYTINIEWYETMDSFNTYEINEKYTDLNLDDIYKQLSELPWTALDGENNIFEIETDTFIGRIYVQSATVAIKESWKDKQSLSGFIFMKQK